MLSPFEFSDDYDDCPDGEKHPTTVFFYGSAYFGLIGGVCWGLYLHGHAEQLGTSAVASFLSAFFLLMYFATRPKTKLE